MTAARRFHAALIESIEARGMPAPRRLIDVYDRFNTDYFDGLLGRPCLLVMSTSSPRALGDYCGQDEHGIESRIRIRPSVPRRGDRFVDDVVLHEMIHAWQHEVAHETDDGYRGHGPAFARKCSEIGSRIGLLKVSPRGRNGMPDCARWPACVRPPGYYGDEPAAEGKSREVDAVERVEPCALTAHLTNALRRYARQHPELSPEEVRHAVRVFAEIVDELPELPA